jgi:hypothetical protein
VSATSIPENLNTSLPQDVCEAAGLKPGDHIDSRFEKGGIRGRTVIPRRIIGKLVNQGGFLVCDTDGLTIDAADIAQVLKEERDR